MGKGRPYKVGYKNPPRHTQFKPGVSGNPGGRKRRVAGIVDELLKEFQRLMLITVGGKTRKLTVRNAYAKRFAEYLLKNPSVEGLQFIASLESMANRTRNEIERIEADVELMRTKTWQKWQEVEDADKRSSLKRRREIRRQREEEARQNQEDCEPDVERPDTASYEPLAPYADEPQSNTELFNRLKRQAAMRHKKLKPED